MTGTTGAAAAGARPRPSASRAAAGWQDGMVALALALGFYHLFRWTAPAVVNLDGLGYLKQMVGHEVAAGHLLYLPLLRLVTASFHGDRLRAGVCISAGASALAVVLTFAAARALLCRRAALLAALGLGCSYGTWVEGADVEVYACALAALAAMYGAALVYRRSPSLPAALGSGLLLGVAVLFHLTHVLLAPLLAHLLASTPRARRPPPLVLLAHIAVALGAGGLVVLAGYANAAVYMGQGDLAGAARWVLTAGHGFAYRGGALARLGDSVYGLCRALVYAPYLDESNAQLLLGQFVLGLAALALLVGVAVRHRSALRVLPLGSFALWSGVYAAMAFAFFGSDYERWLFVLPVLWMAAAAGAAATRRGSAVLAAGIACMAALNYATAIGPARVATWTRTRADVAAASMSDGDLVVFPGHDWDEYVGFYTGTRIEPFPLAYYAGLLGPEGCLRYLEHEIADARERGRAVYAVRLFEPDHGDDRHGFYELDQLGLPRDALQRIFGRRKVVPLRTREPKVTLWRIDDPPQ